MADKITYTNELKLGMKFKDSDTRTFTLDDPKADITAADILDLENFIKDKKILIGDKAGADFVRFDSAEVTEKTKISLDLS